MEKVSDQEKKGLLRKFNEFQVSGLRSYRKYLEKELASSAGKENKKAYARYIEKELKRADERIAKLIKDLD